MTSPSPPLLHRARAERMLRDLKKAGLKMTSQRVAIVELFAGDESHPTAQALFERLMPNFPKMSFATVYNTLDALSRAGLSSTLRIGQAARFDPNTVPHHHTVCDECGAVRDVMPGRKDHASRKDFAQKVPGFAVRTVEQIYRGACRSCTSAKRAHAKSSGASSSREKRAKHAPFT